MLHRNKQIFKKLRNSKDWVSVGTGGLMEKWILADLPSLQFLDQ